MEIAKTPRDSYRARTISQVHRSPNYNITRSKTTEPFITHCSHVRSPTLRDFMRDHGTTETTPWEHMAQTYEWVVGQEHARLEKQNKKTEQWVSEQISLAEKDGRRHRQQPPMNINSRWRIWEDLMQEYETDAQKWIAQEQEFRRQAQERANERARVIQEEMDRIQARIQQRKDVEKRRMAEERQKAAEAMKERERKDQLRTGQAIADAWQSYEDRWATLPATSKALTFQTIPWPLNSLARSPTDIIPANIVRFILSPSHSKDQSRKDRVRNALLRWHPDRFRRLLSRVPEKERSAVEEGVGIVARCLNDLMTGGPVIANM